MTHTGGENVNHLRLDVEKIIKKLALKISVPFILDALFSFFVKPSGMTGGIRTTIDCLVLIVIGNISWHISREQKTVSAGAGYTKKVDVYTIKSEHIVNHILSLDQAEVFKKYNTNGTLKKARLISGLIHEIMTAVELGDGHLEKIRNLIATNLTIITTENYEGVEFFGFPFLPYMCPNLIQIPFLQHAAKFVQKDLKSSLEVFEA